MPITASTPPTPKTYIGASMGSALSASVLLASRARPIAPPIRLRPATISAIARDRDLTRSSSRRRGPYKLRAVTNDGPPCFPSLALPNHTTSCLAVARRIARAPSADRHSRSGAERYTTSALRTQPRGTTVGERSPSPRGADRHVQRGYWGGTAPRRAGLPTWMTIRSPTRSRRSVSTSDDSHSGEMTCTR